MMHSAWQHLALRESAARTFGTCGSSVVLLAKSCRASIRASTMAARQHLALLIHAKKLMSL
jgi:hypothetical protein